MAMQAKVPVIPVYIEGLRDVMPKGQRTPRPAAVSARVGAPVSLEGVASVPEGTALLENAMRALAGMPPHHAARACGAESTAWRRPTSNIQHLTSESLPALASAGHHLQRAGRPVVAEAHHGVDVLC